MIDKNNTLVSTLPIKPQSQTNIGMLLAPTIMDFIGTVLNIKKVLGVNILNTYCNKNLEIENYIREINNSNISYDYLFLDKQQCDKLIEIVKKMYNKGLIKEKKKEIIRCDCGKIDMLSDSQNNNAKLYHSISGKLYCNSCNEECKTTIEDSLVFEIAEENDDISIIPGFYKKEISEFSKGFKGKNILISKYRDTGLYFNTPNRRFNIDIDFMWSNLFDFHSEENQIYIASNHQLFLMYLINYVSKIVSNKKIIFIVTPYIDVNLKEAKKQYNLIELKEYKELLLLYNLKWNNKDCKWSDSNFEYLKNISKTKIKNLYASMLYSSRELLNDCSCLTKVLNDILVKNTNMQNNIKCMKRMYKEGKLSKKLVDFNKSK